MVVPGYRIFKVESRGEGKFTEILCDELHGGIGETSDARLFPGGHLLRIKSAIKTDGRCLLSIKGISRSSLRPGGVLIPADWPVGEYREALLLHDGGPIPQETEAVHGGISSDFNSERFVGRASFRSDGSFISIRFPEPYPLFPGADITILDSSGVPRVLTVFWPGRPEQDQLRRLNSMARRRPEPHPPTEEILGRILHVAGFVEMPPGPGSHDWPESSSVGGWYILNERRAMLERRILKLVSRPGGADDSILKVDECPASLLAALCADMEETGKLKKQGRWYFPPGPPPLAPFHRGWIDRIEKAGEEGVRVRSVSGDADRDALEVLHRSGLIRGGSDIWLSRNAVDILEGRLLADLKPGDRVSMSFARDRLGGSRLRTLELLTVLEGDGRIAREEGGEDRLLV